MKTFIYSLVLGGIIIISTLLLLSNNKDQNPNTENHESIQDSSPIERREYFKLRRGGEELNPKKVSKAKKIVGKQITRMVKESRDGMINGWESLGPGNIGGRVRAIAIHPTNHSTMFAGAAAGGIWKTTNSGASWSIVGSATDSYPVMDIIFHPTNPNIMFAVTGEYKRVSGVGVIRSLNGGDTWAVMNQPPTGDFTYLSKIRYHPEDNNIMFAAGCKFVTGSFTDAVVYKSTDAGINWAELWTEPSIDSVLNSTHVYDMEIVEGTPWRILIGTENRAYFSYDNALNFSMINLGDSGGYKIWRHEVQACKSDPDIIYIQRYLTKQETGGSYTYRTELWKSEIGIYGFSLETLTSSLSPSNNVLGKQGNYDNVLWVNPINCDQVLMGGIEMYRYESGDDSPTQISDGDDDIDANSWESHNNSIHVDQHVIVESPSFNNTTNAYVFIGNDGGVYGTIDVNNAKLNSNGNPDSTTTWFSLVNNMEITQFYGGDISIDGNTAVGGSQDNHHIFDNNVSDQTKTWNAYSRGDGGPCRVDKTNNNKFYTTTQNGVFYRTDDGGQTFCNTFRVGSGSQNGCCTGCYFESANDNPLFIAPMEMSPSNNTHLYIGGENLFKSNNSGSNWTAMTNLGFSSKVSAIGVAHHTEDTLWFGKSVGGLYYTFDGGANWDFINNTTHPTMTFSYTTDIAIHPNNSNLVAVTQGGYHQNHIYITTDGGQSWESKSLGFDMQVNTVTWMPDLEEVIYVGTNIGVFASEDQGNTWSVMPYLSSSEGPVYVAAMELFWQGDGSTQYPYRLGAATYGRGMWRTTNPIYSKLYVNKNCNPCGTGTLSSPFKYFSEAVEKALPGSEITFLSSGDHIDIASPVLVDKKIKINHSTPIIIK